MVGCSSLSQDQCLADDWETIGHRDGVRGKPDSAELLRHQKACGKHGVVPDSASYRRGWAEGVRSYCTPDNGFSEGRSGQRYNNVCPAQLDAEFRAAFEDGKLIYRAEQSVSNAETSLLNAEQRLEKVTKKLTANERALIDGGQTSGERYDLVNANKELAKEQGELEERIKNIVADIALLRRDLDDLEATLGYR